MTKALITGARGFIGQALTRELVRAGYEVICFNRSPAKGSPAKSSPGTEASQVQQFQGDVQNQDDLAAAMKDVDVVFHLAAIFATRTLEQSRKVNVEGTRNVIEAAAAQATPPTVIYVSSLAAAGPGESLAIETSDRQPVSRYGISKREAEAVLQQFASQVPITIVRPPCVFGQGDKNMLPLFHSVQKGWNVVVSKTSEYSFVHVDDVVAGLLAAADRGKRLLGPEDAEQQGIYFVTDPQPVTFVELADMIAQQVNQPRVRHIQIPSWAAWSLATGCEAWMRVSGSITFLNYDKLREGFAGSWTCSAARAEAELGYTTPKSLSERLAETKDHYVEQGLLELK